jgi:hypothetical protein
MKRWASASRSKEDPKSLSIAAICSAAAAVVLARARAASPEPRWLRTPRRASGFAPAARGPRAPPGPARPDTGPRQRAPRWPPGGPPSSCQRADRRSPRLQPERLRSVSRVGLASDGGDKLAARHPASAVRRRKPRLQLLSRWARQDSNLGPTDYESAALTAELRAPRRLKGNSAPRGRLGFTRPGAGW